MTRAFKAANCFFYLKSAIAKNIKAMKRFAYKSRRDAVRTKNWAAGASALVESTEFIIKDGKPQVAPVNISPALFKIFDEILVNATDQATRMAGTKQPVKNIWVTAEPAGRIVIKNDGAGFEVCQVDVPELGGIRWLPAILVGEFDQGTNHDDEADKESIGGTNGLGASITVAMSTRLILRTRDADRGLYFEQTWIDGGKTVMEPIIRKENGPGFTEIEFYPDYAAVFKSSNPAAMLPVFHGRTALSALYTTLAIYFNGEKQLTAPADIMRQISPASVVESHILFENKQWQIFVQLNTAKICIVNGMVVKRGPHIVAVENKLTEIIIAAANKGARGKVALKRDAVMKCLGYILICTINSPKPSWEGQRKDVLVDVPKRYAELALPPKSAKQIAEMAKNIILELASRRRKTNKDKIEKYIPATGKNPTLICAEGDSAISQIRSAVTNHRHMTFERFGLFSLGGVIVNVRKNLTIRTLPNGFRLVDMSEKLQKNTRINEFLRATGLRYEYTYTTEAERKTLRYKAIWMVPDQDYDGKGKILPLVLSFIEYCWPALLQKNATFVYWVYSPIIRLYPKTKGKVLEFYSVHEFENSNVDLSKYDEPKYYKGLASHDDDESNAIFNNPPVYALYLDDNSRETFEIYLGEDPAKRKYVLKLPSRIDELVPKGGAISCSEQLQCEADRYQKDDLARKLDCYLDGLTLSGRKILDGCLAKFANSHKPVKVDSLAGYILEKKQYEHGVASLCDSIKGKAGIYTGGRQLPILCPYGMFGSRLGGAKDAGAARYISAALNYQLCDVLYPAADYELLPFTINEGVQGEPKYFLPIIPTAITEHTELPSHGWKLEKWAIDALAVIDATRLLIAGRQILPKMPYYRGDWTGEYRQVGNIAFAVGKYYISGDTIIVTELPICTWTNPWVQSIEKMMEAEEERGNPLIISIDDSGNNEHSVLTRIGLAPGALAKISQMATGFFTGVEVYLGLYTKMDNFLNFMTEDMTVREFKSYEDICRAWFPHRRQAYIDRIERRLLRLRCNIELLQYQVRYIEVSKGISLKKEKDVLDIVNRDGYPPLAEEMLSSKQFMPNAEFNEKFHCRGPYAKSNTVGYNYLFGITERDKFEENYAKRKDKMAKLQAELTELEAQAAKDTFPGCADWLAELDKLADIVARGRQTMWKFDRKNKYSFD